MQKDQKTIYYIVGEDEGTIKNSPLLEVYKEKDIEVLLLSDEIDEIIMPAITDYKETPLKAINKTGADEELKTKEDKDAQKDFEDVLKKMKDILKDEAKDVKISSRLSESPSCIVADKDDMNAQMAQMFAAMGQEAPKTMPILEINPKNDIVLKLKDIKDESLFEDISHLLFEEALILSCYVLS
jgi:molecular chaperone HtpG